MNFYTWPKCKQPENIIYEPTNRSKSEEKKKNFHFKLSRILNKSIS